MFFAVAIIEQMRDKIIAERMKFDDLLKVPIDDARPLSLTKPNSLVCE